MPDSLRKVLLGTLIGALVVGFAWHIVGERAKRAPMAVGGAPAARRGDRARSPRQAGRVAGRAVR